MPRPLSSKPLGVSFCRFGIDINHFQLIDHLDPQISGGEKTVTQYKHTQFGVLTLIILLLVGALVIPVILALLGSGSLIIGIVTIALYLLILALFYALTVEISGNQLRFWFGFGGIRKSYSLQEIQNTKEVTNPWYFLWGIKSIPGGWLYAIAPGRAVEIVFNDGKMVRIGTNQPTELKRVIDQTMISG